MPWVWAASQRLGHLHTQLQHLLHGQRLASNVLPQRLALQQFHDDELLALLLVNLVDGADVGVIQSRGRAGLALEPLHRLAVPAKLFGQNLEGNAAAQPAVLGFIDDPPTAASQLLQDAVVGNCLADHERDPTLDTPCSATGGTTSSTAVGAT